MYMRGSVRRVVGLYAIHTGAVRRDRMRGVIVAHDEENVGPRHGRLGARHRVVLFGGDEVACQVDEQSGTETVVSYTHLRAHETVLYLVCRLPLGKNNGIDN